MDRGEASEIDVLSTSQIENALNKCRVTAPYFRGVFALDRLPQTYIVPRPALVVQNTAYSDSAGEHWTAYYLNTKNSVEYFDSYGLPPKGEYMARFITANDLTHNFNYNTIPLQSLEAATCGKYAVTYLYFRTLGYTVDQYISILGEKPDKKVRWLYKKHFGEGSGGCEGGQICYKYG